MIHTITPRRFLTAKEAAQFLGGRSNRETVIDLINAGKLKGKKVSNSWRILPEWLDEFMSKPDEIITRSDKARSSK